MKFKLRRPFSIQVDAASVKKYSPGEYAVPKEMTKYHADRAATMRLGEYVVQKKAPENKVVQAAENKAKVAGKPVRGSSTGAKSKSKRRTKRS